MWILHHHHQSELVGDVAVPVSVRRAVLFWALRSPDARPRLNWRRSSNTVLSQVCLGRPGRLILHQLTPKSVDMILEPFLIFCESFMIRDVSFILLTNWQPRRQSNDAVLVILFDIYREPLKRATLFFDCDSCTTWWILYQWKRKWILYSLLT